MKKNNFRLNLMNENIMCTEVLNLLTPFDFMKGIPKMFAILNRKMQITIKNADILFDFIDM